MTTHSGSLGMIEGGKFIKNWSITDVLTLNPIVNSATKGGTNRESGIGDWTGSYAAHGDTPIHMPGSYVDLEAYRAPDASDNAGNGDIYSGNVYIESVAITIDFSTNMPISYVTNFGGNSELVVTQGAAMTDANPVVTLTPCAGKVTHYDGGAGAETIIEHVKTAVLTITRPSKTAVNSGDVTGDGKCITTRRPSTAIDWNVAITTEEGVRNATLIKGVVKALRLYTTSTLHWDLAWGKLKDVTGLTVDVESGNLLSQTYNFEMKGFLAGNAGFIKKPGGTIFWPAP